MSFNAYHINLTYYDIALYRIHDPVSVKLILLCWKTCGWKINRLPTMILIMALTHYRRNLFEKLYKYTTQNALGQLWLQRL